MAGTNTKRVDGNKIDALDNIAEPVGDARSGDGIDRGNRGSGIDGDAGRNRKRRAGNSTGNAARTETIVEPVENILLGDEPPLNVPLISVSAKRGRKPGTKKKDAVSVDLTISDNDISQILEWAFRVPTFYGWGEHWILTSGELADLTVKTRAVLDQFPETLLEKYGAVTSKYFAPVSLIISVATLCYSRYTTTLLLKKYEFSNQPVNDAGRTANRTAEPRETPDYANGNPDAGDGQNPANGKADIRAIFGRDK